MVRLDVTRMTPAVICGLVLLTLTLATAISPRRRMTVGVNLSGLEEGGKKPGVPNVDFAVPTAEEHAYLSSRGMSIIRLPFLWERMQPIIRGPLAPAYLALVQTEVQFAVNNSLLVLLDCHNFGRAFGAVLNGTTGNLTSQDFADLWLKVAAVFAGKPGILGYDIMNEPNNMPTSTAWPDAAQAAINAIRTVDKTTPIYVEGDHWSGAQNWGTNNPFLHLLTDNECGGGAGCIVWSAHCYLDRDSSGTHFNWTAEVEAGVTVHTGADRLADFATWLTQYKYTRAHVGEMGTGNDNIGWLIALDNAMTVMSDGGWEFTYWSAGPWFDPNYGYDVDARKVLVNGKIVLQDPVQMAVLTQHAGAPAPTIYFLAGPTRGPTSDVSSPFALTYRGYITRNITFKCFVESNGGSRSLVSTTECPVGYNCDSSFQVNVSTSGSYSVYCENDGGLQDAPRLLYNASSDLFLGAAADAANVFSLRHLYTSYDGPAVNLRRSTDNETMDFGYTSDGELDTTAVQKWCSAPQCITYLAQWYDQSPNRWHAGKVVSDFSGAGNHNVSIADQPTLVVTSATGHPRAHIHFDGTRRMDAKSPIDKLTGQTVLAMMSLDGTGDSDRLLSWAFVQNLVFPMDGGYLTTDSPTAVSLNLTHTPGWHRYAGRWQAATVNGKTAYRDNVLTGAETTSAGQINFQYRDIVNIGWFRWYSPVFSGDVCEMIVFSGALSDGDLQRFDRSEQNWIQPTSNSPHITDM